jgi:hypothetical protein
VFVHMGRSAVAPIPKLGIETRRFSEGFFSFSRAMYTVGENDAFYCPRTDIFSITVPKGYIVSKQKIEPMACVLYPRNTTFLSRIGWIVGRGVIFGSLPWSQLIFPPTHTLEYPSPVKRWRILLCLLSGGSQR